VLCCAETTDHEKHSGTAIVGLTTCMRNPIVKSVHLATELKLRNEDRDHIKSVGDIPHHSAPKTHICSSVHKHDGTLSLTFLQILGLLLWFFCHAFQWHEEHSFDLFKVNFGCALAEMPVQTHKHPCLFCFSQLIPQWFEMSMKAFEAVSLSFFLPGIESNTLACNQGTLRSFVASWHR